MLSELLPNWAIGVICGVIIVISFLAEWLIQRYEYKKLKED